MKLNKIKIIKKYFYFKMNKNKYNNKLINYNNKIKILLSNKFKYKMKYKLNNKMKNKIININ